MIYVIARSVLKPGCREEFLKICLANVPRVTAEDGCIFYKPCLDADAGRGLDPDAVTFVECWESPAHLKAHLAQAHMVKFMNDVRDLRKSSTLSVVTPA